MAFSVCCAVQQLADTAGVGSTISGLVCHANSTVVDNIYRDLVFPQLLRQHYYDVLEREGHGVLLGSPIVGCCAQVRRTPASGKSTLAQLLLYHIMAPEPSTPFIWIEGWPVRAHEGAVDRYYFLRLTIVNVRKVRLRSRFLQVSLIYLSLGSHPDIQEQWTMFSTLFLVTMLVLPTFVRITRI